MKFIVLASLFSAASCFGAAILLPGGSLTVPGTTSAGASFTYSGTLTQADTLDLVESGLPCLQSANTYCTNGAGIVVVPGSTGTGGTTTFSGTINGTANTWNYGALLLEISGFGTVQIFPATVANGLGSGSPPSSLTLNTTTLSSLGFGSFSAVNPTITFALADTNFADNSGSFTLRQAAAGVPEPATFGLFAIAGVALLLRRR